MAQLVKCVHSLEPTQRSQAWLTEGPGKVGEWRQADSWASGQLAKSPR